MHSADMPAFHVTMDSVQLGLELKEKWCLKLLNGEKRVELRRYPIDAAYIGRPVYLLQTPNGSEGQSTLPSSDMPAGYPGACIAGVVVFGGQTTYTSYEQWLADEDKHWVAPDTPYSWQPGVTQAMYGWHVTSVRAVHPPAPVPAMRRTYSSWFTVVDSSTNDQPDGGQW